MQALDIPVTRTNPAAGVTNPWNLDEAITQEESLTFYTRNVAYQMFRENERGTFAHGKKADFIVLRGNEIESIFLNGEMS
jgi:predicted amidohydrolase YtcJ